MYVYEAEDEQNCESVYIDNKYRDNELLCNWLLSFCLSSYESYPHEILSGHKLSPYEEKILAKELHFLEKMPGDVIMDGDKNYPDSLKNFLGAQRPKVLFYMGKKSILKLPSIMVCGAREVSEKGIEIAYKCGKLIVKQGYSVASGYARGVDRAAHLGALEAGGNTIAVLPYGLSRFRVHRNIAEVFEPG